MIGYCASSAALDSPIALLCSPKCECALSWLDRRLSQSKSQRRMRSARKLRIIAGGSRSSTQVREAMPVAIKRHIPLAMGSHRSCSLTSMSCPCASEGSIGSLDCSVGSGVVWSPSTTASASPFFGGEDDIFYSASCRPYGDPPKALCELAVCKFFAGTASLTRHCSD